MAWHGHTGHTPSVSHAAPIHGCSCAHVRGSGAGFVTRPPAGHRSALSRSVETGAAVAPVSLLTTARRSGGHNHRPVHGRVDITVVGNGARRGEGMAERLARHDVA